MSGSFEDLEPLIMKAPQRLLIPKSASLESNLVVIPKKFYRPFEDNPTPPVASRSPLDAISSPQRILSRPLLPYYPMTMSSGNLYTPEPYHVVSTSPMKSLSFQNNPREPNPSSFLPDNFDRTCEQTSAYTPHHRSYLPPVPTEHARTVKSKRTRPSKDSGEGRRNGSGRQALNRHGLEQPQQLLVSLHSPEGSDDVSGELHSPPSSDDREPHSRLSPGASSDEEINDVTKSGHNQNCK